MYVFGDISVSMVISRIVCRVFSRFPLCCKNSIKNSKHGHLNNSPTGNNVSPEISAETDDWSNRLRSRTLNSFRFLSLRDCTRYLIIYSTVHYGLRPTV